MAVLEVAGALLLLFVAAFIVSLICMSVGLDKGDPARLLYGTDIFHRCSQTMLQTMLHTMALLYTPAQ